MANALRCTKTPTSLGPLDLISDTESVMWNIVIDLNAHESLFRFRINVITMITLHIQSSASPLNLTSIHFCTQREWKHEMMFRVMTSESNSHVSRDYPKIVNGIKTDSTSQLLGMCWTFANPIWHKAAPPMWEWEWKEVRERVEERAHLEQSDSLKKQLKAKSNETRIREIT